MTIAGLMSMVRKKHGDQALITATGAIRKVLAGGGVAVDAANHVHRLAHARGSDAVPDLVASMRRFVEDLRATFRVGPVVLVADGPSAAMKNCEQERRARARKSSETRLVQKREALARLEADGGETAVHEMGLSHVDRIVKNASLIGGAMGDAASSAVFSSSFTFVDMGESDEVDRRRMHAATVHTLRASIERDAARQSLHVTRAKVEEVCAAVAAGVPSVTSVTAPGDGEMVCAALAANGEVRAVVSNDSDTVALGVEWTLRWLGKEVALLDLPTLRHAMGVTQDELRVACVLAGSDFSPHIRNLGIATALKHVKKRGASVPAVLRSLKTVKPRAGHMGPTQQPSDARVAQGEVCPTCARPSYADGHEVLTTCSACHTPVCGRARCWADHCDACFRGEVGMAMVEAEAAFAAAGTQYAEEDLLADAAAHGDPIWCVGPRA